MSTPPRDREVFAVDVSNGIRSRTGHRPRGQVGNRAYCALLCHVSLQSPPTVLATSLSTYPRPHAVNTPRTPPIATATRSLPDSLLFLSSVNLVVAQERPLPAIRQIDCPE